MTERERLADAFRDWVHESPLSQCNMGADECPDWPLAYELADVALEALASTGAVEASEIPGQTTIPLEGPDVGAG